ncbi:MAG: hypothetical protein ACI31S_04415 [Bacilli bacterium]
MKQSEKNNTLLENKDHSSVIAYLQFLQNNITRMATNSSNTKAFIAVIFTILVTMLTTTKSILKYWWLGIIFSLLGTILDSYYLAFERMYRKKYNSVCKDINNNNLNVEDIYNMNPKNTNLKFEHIAEMLDAISSFSVWGFYILFIIISILLKFI